MPVMSGHSVGYHAPAPDRSGLRKGVDTVGTEHVLVAVAEGDGVEEEEGADATLGSGEAS